MFPVWRSKVICNMIWITSIFRLNDHTKCSTSQSTIWCLYQCWTNFIFHYFISKTFNCTRVLSFTHQPHGELLALAFSASHYSSGALVINFSWPCVRNWHSIGGWKMILFYVKRTAVSRIGRREVINDLINIITLDTGTVYRYLVLINFGFADQFHSNVCAGSACHLLMATNIGVIYGG